MLRQALLPPRTAVAARELLGANPGRRPRAPVLAHQPASGSPAWRAAQSIHGATQILGRSCEQLRPLCGCCPSQPTAGHALVGLLTSEHLGRPGLLVIAQASVRRRRMTMASRLGLPRLTRSQRRDRPGLPPEFPVRRRRKRRAADHQRSIHSRRVYPTCWALSTVRTTYRPKGRRAEGSS